MKITDLNICITHVFGEISPKQLRGGKNTFEKEGPSEINRTPNWSRKDKNAGIILLPQICRGCKHARVTCILGGKKKTRNLLSYILFYSNNRTFTKCSFCFLPTPTIPPTTTEINCKLLKKSFFLALLMPITCEFQKLKISSFRNSQKERNFKRDIPVPG